MKNDNIKFHYKTAEDPDCIVKNECLILIVEATEIEKCANSLPKDRKGKGRNHFPNLGKHMSKNQFKTFLVALSYLLLLRRRSLTC